MELIYNEKTGNIEVKKILELDYKNFDFSKNDFEEYLKEEVEKEKPHGIEDGIFNSIYNFVLKKYNIEVVEELNEKNEIFIKNFKFITRTTIRQKKREIEFFESVLKEIK